MKHPTSSPPLLLAALSLSLFAAAPLGALQHGAIETQTSAILQPELSLLKDANGYALHLRYPESGAVAEFLLGVEMVGTPTLPGIPDMVVPLFRQPVVLGPVQAGAANAFLPLPITLATLGASFYVQAVVYDARLPSGMVATPGRPVLFSPDSSATVCPKEEGDVLPDSSSSASASVQLAGWTSWQLAALFAGEDDVLAEAAYLELYGLGKPSIDALLSLANHPDSGIILWAGDNAFEATASSFVRFQGSAPISVRRMALYLISAIAMENPTPYGMNELRTPANLTAPVDELDQLALDGVNLWWLQNGHKSLAELRSEARPLGRNGVDFGLPQAPAYLLPAGSGPATPLYKNVSGAIVDVTLGEQFFLASAVVAKKDPYNCLSWAVHCDNCHGWVQPCKPTGDAIDDWMKMNGWSMMPPAGGAMQTVIIQKHCNLPPLLPGSTWVHAMKKMPNCTWSSKNGAGRLHFGITDPEGFGNMHYPPPPATTSKFEKWYK